MEHRGLFAHKNSDKFASDTICLDNKQCAMPHSQNCGFQTSNCDCAVVVEGSEHLVANVLEKFIPPETMRLGKLSVDMCHGMKCTLSIPEPNLSVLFIVGSNASGMPVECGGNPAKIVHCCVNCTWSPLHRCRNMKVKVTSALNIITLQKATRCFSRIVEHAIFQRLRPSILDLAL